MKYLSELIRQNGPFGESFFLEGGPRFAAGKKRVNILALGDVGGMLLTGLTLLGEEIVESIGIYDLDPQMLIRYEYEMNQTNYPFHYDKLPEVVIINEGELFDCDVFLFCASKATPLLGSDVQDVRMVQYEANKPIVEHYARLAGERGFEGLFGVVSDPVDPLCNAALSASPLKSFQIQGFGLGVMNSRAAYYAKKNPQYEEFLTEGRSFGPHGEGLVIANSISQYQDQLSIQLTKLTVEANLRTREAGFKPYIAPALSSGAISVLLTLSGEWHYSSNYLSHEGEGAFLGSKNRMWNGRTEIENPLLPDILFDRIKKSFDNLINL